MVDFGEPDRMIKIRGKVNKSNAYNGFTSNKEPNERNITTKLVANF